MLTLTQYEQHRELMAERDAIISELRNHETTHITTRPTWHGYDIEAGTHLVASPELLHLLDEGRSEIRDAHGCVASWYVLQNGHIANLWACEVDEYEAPYCCGDDAKLPEGVEITRTHFTGQPLAVCHRCEDFRVAYWECACELVHECVTDDEGADE